MKSPREYLQEMYPEYEAGRGLSGHDDEYTELMMLKYAQYCTVGVQADGLSRLLEWVKKGITWTL